MRTVQEPDGVYLTQYHGLSDKEFKTILPAIKRELKHAQKMAEHYADLISDGYGTERQDTARIKWEEKEEILSSIVEYSKTITL